MREAAAQRGQRGERPQGVCACIQTAAHLCPADPQTPRMQLHLVHPQSHNGGGQTEQDSARVNEGRRRAPAKAVEMISNSHNLFWNIRLLHWLSRSRICLQCWRHRRQGFDPWIRKIPWRREWQPTPVFLPGEFHGQKSLAGYSPRNCKESDAAE